MQWFLACYMPSYTLCLIFLWLKNKSSESLYSVRGVNFYSCAVLPKFILLCGLYIFEVLPMLWKCSWSDGLRFTDEVVVNAFYCWSND